MSHVKYHTEAIILKRVGTGEADRYVWALTRDFGTLGFHVRSARKLSSKQRFHLEPLSCARISLVRGKNMWRLTNVGEASLNFDRGGITKQQRKARIISLLSRFLHGEEPNRELYDTVHKGLSFFEKVNETTNSYLESLITLRILFLLGYIKKEENISSLLESISSYNSDVLSKVSDKGAALQLHIDRAVLESGL